MYVYYPNAESKELAKLTMTNKNTAVLAWYDKIGQHQSKEITLEEAKVVAKNKASCEFLIWNNLAPREINNLEYFLDTAITGMFLIRLIDGRATGAQITDKKNNNVCVNYEN